MGKKIVFVDDEPINIELLGEIFALSDHTAIGFTQGRKALAYLEKEESPDLLVLDIRMPGLSGPEIAEKIRKNDKLKGLKIVFLTGSSTPDKDLLTKYNALGFILKPFSIDQLFEKIEAFLTM